MTSIVDGVLLSRYGAVHQDVGGGCTRCGEPFDPARVAEADAKQTLAYRLVVCPKCYPANHDGPMRLRTGR